MNKIIPSAVLVVLSLSVYGQYQFTNNGNFQTFRGVKISYYGNFVNNGTFTDNGLEIYFSGGADQTISSTSALSVRHLDVNNAGGFTMLSNLTVRDTLELSKGPLFLNSHTLTLNNGALSAVSRTDGYFVSEQTDNSGKIKWNIGSTTGAHVFHFGNLAGNYIPFTLNLTAGTIGNVTVSTYPTASNNTPYPVTPIAVTNMYDHNGNDNSSNVVDRFWQIDKDGVSGTATMIFTAAPSEVGSLTALQAQRWNSGWEAPLPGQSNTAYSVTVPNVSSFSPWTISGNNKPLPVEMLNFTAKKNNSLVELNWATASELNCNYFTVERANAESGQSENELQFANSGNVLSQALGGNSSILLNYFMEDRPEIPSGKNGTVLFYRVRETDFNGNYSYSETRKVIFDISEEFNVNVYPNPAVANDIHVSITGKKDREVLVVLTDVFGKKFYSKFIKLQGGSNNFTIIGDVELSPGIYFINASSDDTFLKNKIIVGSKQ